MKLYDLYLIYKDGRDVFHQDFAKSGLDPSIISGFLQALSDFAKEALPSEGSLKEIEKGDIKVIFNHGKHLSVALVCEAKDTAEINYLKNRLKELISKIETKYEEELVEWSGDLEIFKELKQIVADSFREPVRLSKPPSKQDLINNKESYFYSTDEDGLSVYSIFYRNSWSFKNFLKAINIPLDLVNQILNRLKTTSLNLTELSDEFNLEEITLVKILRNLALRGIIIVRYR